MLYQYAWKQKGVFSDWWQQWLGEPQGERIPDAIASFVLNGIDMRATFKDMDSHMLDAVVNDNHTFTLIKTISKCYSKVHLYHLGKTTTETASKDKVRKKLSKCVLFEHQ